MELNALVNPTREAVFEAQLRAAATALESADSITGVSGPDQALSRQLLPDADLESAGNGWDGETREWTQVGLTAGETAEIYRVDSAEKAENKVIVIFGVVDLSNQPKISEIQFADGTGSVFWRQNLQVAEAAENQVIPFDKQVRYKSTQDGRINAYATDDGDASLALLGRVAEPLGQTVTTRENDR